jgi:hypothetical protein
MRKISRGATLLVAGLALVPSACGSDGPTATNPPPRRSPTPPATPERKPAAANDVAVIRGWANALRSGRVERAASYFALPSLVSNGTSPIKLTSRDDARFFNRTLPCGAKLLQVEDSGAYLVARFRLTERPGPGRCAAGTGGEASTAFLIRDRRIVQWRRVVEPAPGGAPAGTQS